MRLHLFELEDQPWFPAVVRDLATDYLHFIEKRLRLEEAIVPLLAAVIRETGTTRIVDLGSGGSGPLPAVLEGLERAGLGVQATLTDRYPNIHAFTDAAASSGGRIAFVGEPVDARAVPAHLAGLRTIFNAYHHFRPSDAVAVLRDAARARAPIAIFEVPDRTPLTIVSMVLMPLIVLCTTPFIRPFLWRRLFWTYVVPLVPVTCGWDGFVSQLRAYTATELERLAKATASAGYDWRAGHVALGTAPGRITYMIGCPRAQILEPIAAPR